MDILALINSIFIWMGQVVHAMQLMYIVGPVSLFMILQWSFFTSIAISLMVMIINAFGGGLLQRGHTSINKNLKERAIERK